MIYEETNETRNEVGYSFVLCIPFNESSMHAPFRVRYIERGEPVHQQHDIPEQTFMNCLYGSVRTHPCFVKVATASTM
jgi:hypothetical protein